MDKSVWKELLSRHSLLHSILNFIMGRFFQIFISIIPHPGRQEHEVIILLKVRPVGNEVPGRREHKEVRITLGVPQQEIMNSSKLSTFFLQLLERFRKGLINDHGVGEVVRELHRIYNRESHNIPLNEKDLWSIQRDLLNGSYEFSPLKKVVEVTFPSFSGHPIYDSILQFTYGAFPYFEEEVGGTGVFQDRTVLVAEARDELVCRALAAVLRKSLFPLSIQKPDEAEDGDEKRAFYSRVLGWNNKPGRLTKIEVFDLSHLYLREDLEILLDGLEPHLHPEIFDLVYSFLDTVKFRERFGQERPAPVFANIFSIGQVLRRFHLEETIIPLLKESIPGLEFACWKGLIFHPIREPALGAIDRRTPPQESQGEEASLHSEGDTY